MNDLSKNAGLLSTVAIIYLDNVHMKHKPTTKNMHYIPKFYLRQFTDGNGYFYTLDIATKEIKKTTPKGVFNDEYFYSKVTGVKDEFGQAIEQSFQQIETRASKTLRTFSELILNNKHIPDSIFYAMADVMSSFYFRTKAFREHNIKDRTAMLQQLIDFARKHGVKDKIILSGKETTLTEITQAKDSIGKDNRHHYKAMNNLWEMYTATLRTKKWLVYIASENERFFTFDNPFIDRWNKDLDYWSNHIFMRKHFFVVSPKIVIVAIDPSKQSKRLKRKHLNDVEVLALNYEWMRYSNRFVVHKSKEHLLEIRKYLK